MATQNNTNPLGHFTAENTFASSQWHLAELSATEGQVDVCDNAGDIPIGVILNNPVAGGAVELGATPGAIYKVKSDGSGANIAIGDRCGTDASGKLVKKSSDADWYCGIALQASTADGVVIEVLWTGPQQRAS